MAINVDMVVARAIPGVRVVQDDLRLATATN
jgi:hypothetical protein